MLIGVDMLTLLLLFSGASAIDFSSTFSFTRKPMIFRKNDNECRMCYGEYDCVTMEKSRCEYNEATAAVLDDDDRQEIKNTGIKTQIDAMLNNLMLQDFLSIVENFEECIPIISSYTNCNRENICMGCQTCVCDMEGRWNCSLVQHCTREETKVDHRVLLIVMQNLKSGVNSFRVKRSKEVSDDKSTQTRANYEDLSRWLYGATSTQQQHKKMGHLKQRSTKTETNFVAAKNTSRTVAFDEVLSVIGLDINSLSTNDSICPYHTEKPAPSNNIDDFLQMLAFEEGKETTATLDDKTKVVNKFHNDNSHILKDTNNLNEKDANEKLNKQILVEHDVNLMDSLGFLSLLNLMKRDINPVINTENDTSVEVKIMKVGGKNLTDLKNITVGVKNCTDHINNIPYSEKALRDNVLDPLKILITNKHKETEQLRNIRESLIQFMINYDYNSTLHHEIDFDNEKVNPAFKSEIKFEPYNIYRRSNSNNNVVLVEKYFKKLKVDVSEVIKDILEIRKYQKFKVLSNDLKLLLKAITYFLKKNRAKPENVMSKYPIRGNVKNSRRQFDSTIINMNVHPDKEAVMKMLELLDKDMPTSNALSPLSSRAKKLMKRIVNNNYVDDFAVTGLKANGENFNITNNFKTIGSKWQELTKNIVHCAAADQLNNMKLLYFTLSHDIIKMKEASALSNFFYSRRMTVVDENERNDIVNRIDTVLNSVDGIIRHYIKNDNNIRNAQKNTQKLSLFSKIKRMLKSSKKDLVNILRKRPTPKVVKEMARKKIEEEKKRKLTEVMQRWQDNLDIVSFRNRRSIREYTKTKNRMKNIIPHYLRGKLNPALDAQGKSVKKKIMGYKIRPESKARLTNVKKTITTARVVTVRLNKMKRKH